MVEVEAKAEDDEDYEPSGVKPSWAKKLKRKMKKLFCMESHGQYMADVSEKKSRSRHRELLRQFGAIGNSGSEGKATDEEWISHHCPWMDSESKEPTADDGDASDHVEM